MIDGALVQSIAQYLRGTFPGVYVGLPQDDGAISMPAIILQLRSDFVVGSPLQRGNLTVSIMSQADDTTPEEHADFQFAVSGAMRAILDAGNIPELDGVVPVGADEQHAERHWATAQTYTLGFSPKS